MPYLLDYELSGNDADYAQRVLKENVRIRFTLPTNKSKDDSLLSFLEGELLYNNKIYWRARNLWFELNDSYVATADKIFVEFLQQHYLKPQIPDHLFKKFPTPKRGQQDCVRAYAQQYEGLTGYFLPSSVSQRLLFDLMYVDREGKIFMYFIAHNFMAHTASVCARMNNCFEAMKAACEDQTGTGSFKTFYDGLDRKRRARLGESFQIFQSRLKESCIVYALAPLSATVPAGSFCTRDLRQEKDRKVKITREAVQAELGLMKLGNERAEKIVAGLIHQDLRNEGYIDNNDMVTTKFLYCRESGFFENGMRSGLKEAAVYELVTPFQSGFKSLRARFELRYIAQKTVYYTKFIIQDIDSHDVKVGSSSAKI